MRPTSCRLSRKLGTPQLLALDPLAAVRVGTQVVVSPAERVPVEGKILEGSRSVDESLITGENLPFAKQPGDKVTGGAINVDGLLVIETTAVGAQTTLTWLACRWRRRACSIQSWQARRWRSVVSAL